MHSRALEPKNNLIYGVDRDGSGAAVHRIVKKHPKAFYVLFAETFGQELRDLARKRLEVEYPASEYVIDPYFPPSDDERLSFAEKVADHDDELLVECSIFDSGGGFTCYDGFYLDHTYLLNLGLHDSPAFVVACAEVLSGARSVVVEQSFAEAGI